MKHDNAETLGQFVLFASRVHLGSGREILREESTGAELCEVPKEYSRGPDDMRWVEGYGANIGDRAFAAQVEWRGMTLFAVPGPYGGVVQLYKYAE